MFFQDDLYDPGRIWVDRGIGDRLNSFDPCGDCSSRLEAYREEENPWSELILCGDCLSRLEIKCAIDDVLEDRPINLDRRPDLIEAPDPYRLP